MGTFLKIVKEVVLFIYQFYPRWAWYIFCFGMRLVVVVLLVMAILFILLLPSAFRKKEQMSAKENQIIPYDYKVPSISNPIPRESKKKELEYALSDTTVRVILVTGFNQMGKTTLVSDVVKNHRDYLWGEKYSEEHPRRKNPTLEERFKSTLDNLANFMKGKGYSKGYTILTNTQQSLEDKLWTLLEFLSNNKYILVFDGIEVFLTEECEFKHRGFQALFNKCLQYDHKSKIILTSRCEIKGYDSEQSIYRMNLSSGFDENESIQLLQREGITDKVALEIHKRVGGNPFFLLQIAAYAKNHPLKDILRDDELFKCPYEIVARRYVELKKNERQLLMITAILYISIPSSGLQKIVSEHTLDKLRNQHWVEFDKEQGNYFVIKVVKDYALEKLLEKEKNFLGRRFFMQTHNKAADVIENIAEQMFDTGRLGDLRNILDNIDDKVFETRPYLNYWKGRVFQKLDELRDAENCYRKALGLPLKEDLSKKILRSSKADAELVIRVVSEGLGIIYSRARSKYSQAIEVYQVGLEEVETLKNELERTRIKADMLLGIGDIYRRLEEYKKALELLEEAYDIKKEILDKSRDTENSKKGIAYALERQGLIWRYWPPDYEKCFNQHSESLEIYSELGIQPKIALLKEFMGCIYEFQGYPLKAIELFNG